MQIHAPNTVTHGKLLKNSYITELNLEQISNQLDLEMAVNMSLPQKRIKKPSIDSGKEKSGDIQNKDQSIPDLDVMA